MKPHIVQVFLSVVSVVSIAMPGFADEITFRNGDRLTGVLAGFTGEMLDFDADLAGSVEADWESVATLETDTPFYVTFGEQQVREGTLSLEGDTLTIEGPGGATLVAKEAVRAIRTGSEQAAFLAETERQANPGFGDLWAAAVDTGLSLTAGNADTRTLNVALRSSRDTGEDRISLYLTSVFASNTTDGTSATTANAVRGGSRYEINVSDRWFTFGFTDLEFDEFQDLDLRFVLGAGLGVNLRDSARSAFQVFVGGSMNQEHFEGGIRRRSGESVFGEDWRYRITESVSFTERLAIYPNLTGFGEYRGTFDSTLTIAVNEWLRWQLSLSDRYVTNPTTGRERNDILFTTGIRLTLGENDVGRVGPSSIAF